MAIGRALRLFAARRRISSCPLDFAVGPTAQTVALPERAFCTLLEGVGNTQPLTLEFLGFTNASQDFEPKLSRAPPRDVGRRPDKRSSEKPLRDPNPPVPHTPSAEEMKQAALEASYILAGIAGMRIRKPKPAGAETDKGRGQRQQNEAAPRAELAERDEADDEEEEEEVDSARVQLSPCSVQEATEAERSLKLKHPWSEWVEFLNDLQRKGFFEGLEKEMEQEKHIFETYAAVKVAVCAFGRTHPEIFNCLSRKDLRVLADFGCPDVERKACNASKRLRAHFRISEGDVCQRCRLKMTCPRAFFAPEANLRMNTLDVVRIITTFASNTWPDADNHTSYPPEVQKSVCSLLRQFLTYKIIPKQIADDEHVPTERSSVLEPDPHVTKRKVKKSSPVEPKPGDWTCPNCEFLNFNRNRRCRECHIFRPQHEQNAYIGDWHCPKCRYLNFSKNRYCRECNEEQPRKVKWMGGERLPDGDPAPQKLPVKERKYEASDDEESEMSLTDPDESSITDDSFSVQDERALASGLTKAVRSLSKPNFSWDEVEKIKKNFSEFSPSKKVLKVPVKKSERVI